MKKLIFSLIVASLLIATPIQAQSDEAIRASLQEQINILLQLVIQLQDRLAVIIAEQAAQQVQIQQVEEKVEVIAEQPIQVWQMPQPDRQPIKVQPSPQPTPQPTPTPQYIQPKCTMGRCPPSSAQP
jgi:hypothetical protein